jgi:monoamine oxidase
MPVNRRELLKAVSVGALAANSLRAAPKSKSKPMPDVLVIGAGLSGLYAALLLEREGVKVTVLEGRPDRVGGRVYTLHDLPGKPEAGGEVFGPQYGRCLDVLRTLKVPQMTPRPRSQARDSDLMMNVGGENIQLADWPGHRRNPHPEALRAMTPWRVFFEALPKLAAFTSLDDWTKPENARWDIPFAQYLRTQGFNDASIWLQQANSAYGNTLHEVSTAHLFHYFVWARLNAAGAGRTQCNGGNDQLPKGMRAQLRGDVVMDSRVTSLEDRGDAIVAQTDDGRQFRARRAICTLPFSLARNLAFEPRLTGVQWEAVETLPYYATFQIHYEFKRRFWEDDGLPPSIWTDGPIGRINLLYEESGEPACYLVYVNGLQAQYLDTLTAEAADRFVQKELARIRPASRGQLKALRIHSNQNDRFIGGSYAFWKPGMPMRLPQAMSAPHGRIHFAGEHTARAARGMEGAMESGERVALEILQLG